MKYLALVSTLALAASPTESLSSLSDEFNAQALSSDWTMYHQAFGWPDKIKHLSVNSGGPGTLTVEPYHSAWVRDLNAPFLFKAVRGDFDVRARVSVRGRDGLVPGGTWSLGGLMARVPNGNNAGDWKPRMENWHFITTGVGHEPGKVMTETKGTYNSYSSLKLRPFQSGWVELRLTRVGMAMFAMARADGDRAWQVRDRFYRMEGSPNMQVGLVAYTSSAAVPPGPDRPEVENREVNKTALVDMAMDVDWVRFSRPKVTGAGDWYGEVNGTNRLTDPGLTDAQILAAVGS